MKVSAITQMMPKDHSADIDPPMAVPTDPSWYEPLLEAVWSTFGPRRLLFASNFPQIEQTTHGTGAYASDLNVVRTFFERKGRAAAAAFFASTCEELYRLGHLKTASEASL
jgi:predicted TIM-barrel fold metal-dependent hydrolase